MIKTCIGRNCVGLNTTFPLDSITEVHDMWLNGIKDREYGNWICDMAS